jgi:hypothetical protein
MVRAHMADGQTSPTKYILIGCGIALALGVCGVGSCLALAGGGVWYAVEQTEAPAAEARAFLNAIAKGDADGALTHASAGYKGRVNAERLRTVLATHPLKAITDITFSGRRIDTNGAWLAGVVTTEAGETGVEVTVVQEGELWRVDTIRLAGEPLE